MSSEDEMKSYPRFVMRTVRNGRIRFDNQWWKPKEPTNRLNGYRFAFGVYVEGSYKKPTKRLDILNLWGTEEAYNSVDKSDDEIEKAWKRNDELLSTDGYLRQEWWEPVPRGV